MNMLLAELKPGDRELQEALEYGDHYVLRAIASGADARVSINEVLRMYGASGSDAMLAGLRANEHEALFASRRSLSTFMPVLVAYGGCAGSPIVLEGLGARNHAILRKVTGSAERLNCVLIAYGDAVLTGLRAKEHETLFRVSKYVPNDYPMRVQVPQIAACLFDVLKNYGEPGCPAVLEGLAACNHRALRAAAESASSEHVSLLLQWYGEPGCDAVLEALRANDHEVLFSVSQNYSDPQIKTNLIKKVLDAYGPLGGPAVIEGLSARNHSTLRMAAADDNVFALCAVLAAYGEPGCDAVLKALRTNEHEALNSVAKNHLWFTSLINVLNAYGPPGSAAVIEGLSARNHGALRAVQKEMEKGNGFYFYVNTVLEAYGAPGCDAVLAGLRANKHYALVFGASTTRDIVDAVRPVLKAYGPPGCPAVLEALAAHKHKALLMVTCPPIHYRDLCAIVQAYGLPGCAAVLDGLFVNDHEPLVRVCQSSRIDNIRIVARAYGPIAQPPTGGVLKHIISTSTGRKSRHLACMAARDSAFWNFREGRWTMTPAIFTPEERWAMMSSTLLLFKRLPAGAGTALQDYFKMKPWLFFTPDFNEMRELKRS